jgi:hypothetical protein
LKVLVVNRPGTNCCALTTSKTSSMVVNSLRSVAAFHCLRFAQGAIFVIVELVIAAAGGEA